MNKNFRFYGYIGLGIIFISEILLFKKQKFVSEFFTPIVWTGYILFLDALNFKLFSKSLIYPHFKDFLLMLFLSVAFWFIFEFYNLFLQNWKYLNLPENLVIRILGYFWAFSTILPGIFETEILIENTKICALKTKPIKFSEGVLRGFIIFGILCLLSVFLVPRNTARYLAAFVWTGFVFLLDPINKKIGADSFLADLEEGSWNRFFSFFLAGLICGILWEFWNYWTYTKWEYHLPFYAGFKIFEMPILGYLGFLPFAQECFCMYNFSISLLKRKSLLR